MTNPEQIVALVVEDEVIVRCTLVEYLQDAGYQVLSAGNGAAALEILDRGQAVDVLVTDIRLAAVKLSPPLPPDASANPKY